MVTTPASMLSSRSRATWNRDREKSSAIRTFEWRRT
jgi:hypothetical protein